MKFSSILNYTFFLSLLGLLTFSACVDQDFDEPPGDFNLPDITPNTTIAELKARHIAGEFEAVTEDIIVEAVVVSDDGPGNFFRELIIQDSTGGILVFTSATGLSNEYTRGRTVYLKAQGLTLGDFNGTMQIGAGVESNQLIRIEEALLDQFIVKGAKGPDPAPTKVTVDQLGTDVQNRYINTLVEVQNVEFTTGELGKPYATVQQNVNLEMENCDGDELVLRTSGFSTFFTEIVPNGNGSLIGVYSIFRDTRQMRVRDLDDVLLTGDRCDGSSGGGGGTVGTGSTTPNATINDLKALFNGGNAVEITDSIVIEATVVSDDQPGNFFKEVIIQDNTGGIRISVDELDLFSKYPKGSQVFLDAKGLYLGDFNGTLQVGGSSDNGEIQRVAEGVITGHLTRGSETNPVTPTKVTIDQLSTDLKDQYINTLIEVQSIQFQDGELGKTYATDRTSVNLNLEDCNNNSLIIRTSGFSDFFTTQVPSGNGTMVGIYGVFGDDQQIKIRDLDDVNMNSDRCNGGGGGGGGPTTEISISDLRNLYMGTETAAPADRNIKGIVISDRSTEHINGQNLIVQQAGGSGIVVRFSEAHSFDLNDEVEIKLSGGTLSEFNDVLQVTNVPINNASVTGAGSITPALMTIADYIAMEESLESTLIQVENVTINGGGTFGDMSDFMDATGSVATFLRGGATFSGDSYPTSAVTLTAIAGEFQGTTQLVIRNKSDVGSSGGGGGTTGSVKTINESFDGTSDDNSVALAGWTNVVATGERDWIGKSFDGNRFAQASAFRDDAAQMETWLITPEIELDQNKILSFENAQAFYTHDGLSILVSSNFNGTDVSSATWTDISSEALLANNSNANYDWVQSGDIDLSSYTSQGKLFIAFRYVGDKDNNTGTFRIDNVEVRNK